MKSFIHLAIRHFSIIMFVILSAHVTLGTIKRMQYDTLLDSDVPGSHVLTLQDMKLNNIQTAAFIILVFSVYLWFCYTSSRNTLSAECFVWSGIG